MTVTRGTSNSDVRGSVESRRRRREWLVLNYRANVDVARVTFADAWEGPAIESLLPVDLGQGVPACRCYRCGELLTADTLTVDRIIPGRDGGKYVRNNIRPACGPCNFSTGGALARKPKKRPGRKAA